MFPNPKIERIRLKESNKQGKLLYIKRSNRCSEISHNTAMETIYDQL